MCITHSVGVHGVNHSSDVLLVQVLLNENLGRLIPYSPLVVDGRLGMQTLDMIKEYQRRVLLMDHPDGKIDPNGRTLEALHSGMTSGLSQDKLHGIMLQATAQALNKYYQPLVTLMPNSEINTPLRKAHFLAQLGHESDDLLYSEEIASGKEYEGRTDLGNTEKGDGPRFKGRGLMQLTGRANYVAYGKARKQDYVTAPNYTLIATDSNLAVDVSCWFWATHRLNALADLDDLKAITIKINGGTNGLPDRAAHLRRAKCLLQA
jgi:putative chitinase